MTFTPVRQDQVGITLAPDPQRGPWAVVPRFVVLDDGTIRCAGMSVSWCPMMRAGEAGNKAADLPEDQFVPVEWGDPDAMPDPEELTATILRSIPFASITGAMRARLPGLAAIARGFDEWAAEQSGTSAPDRPSVSDHTLRRRKRLDDAHYEEVAKVYRGAKTRPRAAVADHFYVAHSTAARWVTACRERGLLPKTSRGRAAR
jgi:hypothetical protein